MKKSHLLVAAALGLISAASQAALVTYTDKAAFLAVAGSLNTEDFSAAPVGISTSNYSGSFNGFDLGTIANRDRNGIATGSIAISIGDQTPIPSSFANQNFFGWGDADTYDYVGPVSTFSFSAGTTAFGFDWFNTDATNASAITVNSLNTMALDFASGSAASGFFGVIAAGGETFSSASIQTSSNSWGTYVSTAGVDNVLTSRNAPVNAPEPATSALLAAGLAGLAAARRKARRLQG